MSTRLGRALRGLSLACLWLVAALFAAPALAQVQVMQEGVAPAGSTGVVAVAAGWHHSCALRDDGSVFCWGNNDSGQGTPPPGMRFTAISAGWFDTCGVRDNGELACWGQKPELQQVPLGQFTSVAVSDGGHACALRTDGQTVCWGPAFNDGQPQPLGQHLALSASGDQFCGLRTDYGIECWRPETAAWPQGIPGGPYRAVTVQGYACGLEHSGAVRCWDIDNYGIERDARSGVYSAISGTCALNELSHADCWGWAQYASYEPGDQLVTLVTGNDHACGIRGDGSLVCWGGNYHGEASPPQQATTPVPGEGVVPNGQGSVLAIVSGEFHACALRSDGTVSCWGDNYSGQAAAPQMRFSAIGAGGMSTCGIADDGNAICWGDQFGPPAEGPFASVAVGFGHACGLRADGEARCWGHSGSSWQPQGRYRVLSADMDQTCGLRGDGSVECWMPWGNPRVMPGGPYTAISISRTQRCGIEQNGSARCWDRLEDYELEGRPGPLTTVSAGGRATCGLSPDGMVDCWRNIWNWSPQPQGTFTALSLGEDHACGIRQDGSVACWGEQSLDVTRPPKALTVPPSIAAGGRHTCAVGGDGQVDCWGLNDRGQIEAPAGNFVTVDSGENHSCALRDDGQALCWGENSEGQLNAPAMPFAQMSVGRAHGCGLSEQGEVSCWGWNGNGQTMPPEYMLFDSISAGFAHTCGVVKNAPQALCWGFNGDGQTYVPGLPWEQRWLSVQAGDRHSCGLVSDGTIRCWGGDSDGQLWVPQNENFTALSVGAYHNCAIRQGGRVTCWGANWARQSDAPDGRFVSVSAGLNHSCAISVEGTRQCWGDNGDGQAPQRAIVPHYLDWIRYNEPVYFRFSLVEGRDPYYYGPELPAQVRLTAGSLPVGLTLQSNGEVSGTPNQAGLYTFTISGVDENGFGASREYQLYIDATPPVITTFYSWPYTESNGWFTSNIEISWTVEDEETSGWPVSGCDRRMFSADTAGTTVTCTATSPGGTASRSVTIRRDTTAPETSLTATPPAGQGTGQFAFTGSDTTAGISHYECSLDGVAYTTCTSPRSVSVGSGNHTFQVRAVDRAGHRDATPASYAWTVDSTPPVVTSNVTGTQGSNGWYVGNVQIGWTVTDAESEIASKVGCELSTLASDALQATYTCTATSVGGTTSREVAVRRDTVAPDTRLLSTPPAVSNATSATFEFDGSDATSGVVAYECRFDSSSVWQSCSSPKRYENLGHGQHVFYVRAIDAAGHRDELEAGYVFKVDTTPPQIIAGQAAQWGSNGWAIGDVQVTFAIHEPESTYTSTPGCEALTQRDDTAGTSITCSATSVGGSSSNTIVVRRDTVAPDTRFTVTPGNGTDANFAFEGDDATSGVASFECSVDGATFAACASPLNFQVAPGTHTLAVRAMDSAGHRDASPISHVWTADTTAPTVTPSITGTLGNDGWYVGDVQVSWQVADAESTVTSSGCNTVVVTTDTSGAGFSCTATSAGGTTVRTVTVKRDATAPVIDVDATTAPNAAGWYKNDVVVEFSCADAMSGGVTCPAAQVLTGEGAAVASTARAVTDAAGNSAVSKVVTMKIDRTAPTLTPAVTPGTLLLNANTTANANGADALSGIAGQQCAALATGSVGNKTVTCTVTDRAGNSASDSANYRVTYGFNGFTSPVQNPSVLNVSKAGRSVPLRWRVVDAQGAPVSNLGTANVGAIAISCPFSTENRISVYGGSNGQLQNLGNGYYQLDWMGAFSLRGYCRRLELNLGDGEVHPALFKFN